MSAFEAKNLRSGYDAEMDILHGVSFSVEEEECVAFVGANGAGKSTLLKTISGILKPKSGEIIYEGRRVDGLPPHKIVEQGILQVPEEGGVFASLTIDENLRVACRLKRSKDHEQKNKEMVYDFFPMLKEKKDIQAKNLSGGQRKMLSVGKVIMGEPKLLLLDDISMGLAPKVAEDLYVMLKALTLALRIPVILVEQIADIALNFAARGYVMAQGGILLEGSSKELLETDEVKKIYMGG
jgi:branched-chain amino acid transport system ATP-binding protein